MNLGCPDSQSRIEVWDRYLVSHFMCDRRDTKLTFPRWEQIFTKYGPLRDKSLHDYDIEILFLSNSNLIYIWCLFI